MINKEKGGIGIIVGIIIAAIIIFIMMSNGSENEKDVVVQENTDETIMEQEESMEEEDSVMEKEEDMGMLEVMSEGGVLADYSSELLASGPENKVLFFHAGWCPSCRALESSLSENEIPGDLGVYKVDYDNSTELKTKYGITTQHTLVQVDSEGNMITKWLGGNDVDSIVSRLQ